MSKRVKGDLENYARWRKDVAIDRMLAAGPNERRRDARWAFAWGLAVDKLKANSHFARQELRRVSGSRKIIG